MRFQSLSLAVLLPVVFCSPLPEVKRQTPLTNLLSLILARIPAINGPIEQVSGLLTAFTHTIAVLTWQQTTYNDLEPTNPSCKEYTLLFARGTTEPGNVGILVGPAFIEALKEKLGGKARLAIQGVKYDADVEGYLSGGDMQGITAMASHIESIKSKCPSTKLIVSGYSQGGMLIHKSVDLLADDTVPWISKVVIFGDPFSLKQLPEVATDKVRIYCHVGDLICINDALILPAHLTYAIDARSAANFAIS